MNPRYAEAYFNRGTAYGKKAEPHRAIVDFTKAINLKPEFIAEAYYNRGLTYHKKCEFDKAFEDYNETIDLNPDFVAEVYYNRARVWLHRRKWEECALDLTAATDRKMDIATAFCDDYKSIFTLRAEIWCEITGKHRCPADAAAGVNDTLAMKKEITAMKTQYPFLRNEAKRTQI